MPKVSIISPVYNVEPYLRRCLDCLKNQTLEDLEFILIDDCSTDKSLEILREYEENDSRFKIIALEKNSGAAVARNKGLEVATGEYLGFVDPDDAIDLNYYEELYKKAKEKDYDIVKCQVMTFENGKIKKSCLNDEIKKDKLNFTYEWWSAIYKTSLIFDNNIRFRDEIRKSQDTLFLLEVILKANSLECINTVNYHYYKRENSLNANLLTEMAFFSGLKAKCLSLEVINQSQLFEKSAEGYLKLYREFLEKIISLFAYRCKEVDCNKFVAESVIKYFWECKDIVALQSQFQYKHILKYINDKDSIGFTNYLNKYVNFANFYMHKTFLEKIFSVKNDHRNHKILTVLGLKIKLNKHISNKKRNPVNTKSKYN